MTNNCKVDFMNKEISVTKSFFKAAQVYGSDEFYVMMDLQAKLPTFKITFQNHSQPNNKVWYPSYSQMEEYIAHVSKGNSEEIKGLLEEIELARITGKGYNMVRKWFMEKYGYLFDNVHYCEVA